MKLFWLDLETTGLDFMRDLPLEIAVIVTDIDLVEIERFHRVIRWPVGFEQYYIRSSFVMDMHTKSGLIKEVHSNKSTEWPEASMQLCELVKRHEGAYLAGSGVHFDRGFLGRQLPGILDPLHYRNIDVSVLRTFCSLYALDAKYNPPKAHRAMADIEDSIEELRHYRLKLGTQ